MALNPSLGSMDSEYDLGSMQSDLSLAEDPPPPSHGGAPSAAHASQTEPALTCLKPSTPSPQDLSPEDRKAHNHSSVSFREGRRASDTSLTQGAHFFFFLFNHVGSLHILHLFDFFVFLSKPICTSPPKFIFFSQFHLFLSPHHIYSGYPINDE